MIFRKSRPAALLLAPLLAVALACLGCEKSRSTGATRNGKPDGLWQFWHANGQRAKTGEYVDGVEHGPWTFWHPNGQRKEEGRYHAGRKDGPWKTWSDSGQLLSEGAYEQGAERGEWVFYHSNGQRAKVVQYKDSAAVELALWTADGEPQAAAKNSAEDKELADMLAGLRDPFPGVSSQAQARLRSLGAAAVPGLAELMRDGDPKVRYRAVTVLRDMGDDLTPAAAKAVPVLVEALADRQDVAIALVASTALAKCGAEAVGPLTDSLENSPSSQVKRLASQALASLGETALPALPALTKTLRDPEIMKDAGAALARLGEPAVPGLIEALSDSNIGVRTTAARSLGDVGPKAISAVPHLITVLGEPDFTLSQTAVAALGKIGEPAVPLLMETLQSSNTSEQIRKGVSASLGLVGEPAVTALAEALSSKSSDTRRHAAVALEKIGPVAKAALPAIEAALATESDDNTTFYLQRAKIRISK